MDVGGGQFTISWNSAIDFMRGVAQNFSFWSHTLCEWSHEMLPLWSWAECMRVTLPIGTDLWNALRERQNKRLSWKQGQIGEREKEIGEGNMEEAMHTKTDG